MGNAQVDNIQDQPSQQDKYAKIASEWQLTFDSISDCVWLLGADFRILRSNKAAQDFGFSPSEIIGKLCYEIVQGITETLLAFPFKNLQNNKPRFDANTSLADKNVHITIDPIFDEQDRLTGLVHIIRDVTYYKQSETETAIKALNEQLEKQIKDRNALLEHANSEMQAFAYSVSHDLRSPLRGIDGWSQALVEDFGDELNDTAKGYLARVRSEAQRMYDLIDALLKLSRINKREIIVENVNLSLIATAMVAKQKELFPQRKVVVNIQPDVIVSGDKFMLETMMDNLMDNAWKFSGQKDVAQIDFGTIIIEEDHVCFMRDNGVGFNKSYARNLFGVFQRMHRPADFPGIGIGLAIAQRIILRHGGSIWVETALNEGATFYWKLRSS